MALESAADILALMDGAGDAVLFHVKAWNKDVYLRNPSLADRAEWERYAIANNGKLTDAAGAKMAQIMMCNAKGERLFSEDDIPRLLEKGAKGFLEIYTKAIALLTIDEEQIEDLEGNSDANR
jgi:hypothetical protein